MSTLIHALTLAGALALGFAGQAAAQNKPDVLEGPPKIITGDTLEIDGTLIHLYGTDAPEPGQVCHAGKSCYDCNAASIAGLNKLINGTAWKGRPARCVGTGATIAGKLEAICYVQDLNLNLHMVQRGWAFAWRRYSTEYEEAERKARKARRGFWKAHFVYPEAWRSGERLPQCEKAESP